MSTFTLSRYEEAVVVSLVCHETSKVARRVSCGRPQPWGAGRFSAHRASTPLCALDPEMGSDSLFAIRACVCACSASPAFSLLISSVSSSTFASHPTSRLATYLAIHQSIHKHVYIDMRTSIHALPPTMRNAICMSTCLYVYLRVRYLRTSHTRGDNPTQCLVWHTPRATIESDD